MVSTSRLVRLPQGETLELFFDRGKGPFKSDVTLFFWNFDTHPPLRNDNN